VSSSSTGRSVNALTDAQLRAEPVEVTAPEGDPLEATVVGQESLLQGIEDQLKIMNLHLASITGCTFSANDGD